MAYKNRGWGWCIVAEFVKTLKKRNRLSGLVYYIHTAHFVQIRGVGDGWGHGVGR